MRTSSLRNICQYNTGGVFKLTYTTSSSLPHAPRTGREWAGVYWHGLGLSCKLWRSPNGPVLQYDMRWSRAQAVYVSLLLIRRGGVDTPPVV